VSTSQKVLLAVLVLITALFVASVATGSRTGQGNGDSGKGGLVGLLHRATGDAGQVARKDVRAPDCPPDANGVLRVQGSCVLHVGRSGATRQLKLKAGTVGVRVTAPVPRQDYNADKDVDPGAEVDVAVDAKGADVGVACRGAQPQCPVTVLEGS
jgi:hypothetical protein